MSWSRNTYRIEGDIVYCKTTKGEDFTISRKDIAYISMYTFSINKRGYLNARIDKKLRLLHRLVMRAPEHVLVDHINGDKMNNQRDNLRKASFAENMYNLGVRKGSKSGYKGVTKKGEKWLARIQYKKKQYTIGTYDTKEEARDAYNARAVELFGDFARRE